MPSNEVNFFLESQSKKYAKDEKMCEEVLVGLTLTYLNFYDDFLNKNLNKIQKYLNRENKLLTEKQHVNLDKLTVFLGSGKNLINKEQKTINENEFDKYTALSKKDETTNWNEFVTYAEKDLGLTKISNLNYNLQFIIAFHEYESIKQKYFYKMLIQIWNEQNTENLFKKIFEDENFRPKLNENVQLEQTQVKTGN